MLFTACFVTYTMRVNMSINLIAMVEPTKSSDNNSEPECTVVNREKNSNETYQALTANPDVSLSSL